MMKSIQDPARLLKSNIHRYPARVRFGWRQTEAVPNHSVVRHGPKATKTADQFRARSAVVRFAPLATRPLASGKHRQSSDRHLSAAQALIGLPRLF